MKTLKPSKKKKDTKETNRLPGREPYGEFWGTIAPWLPRQARPGTDLAKFLGKWPASRRVPLLGTVAPARVDLHPPPDLPKVRGP